MWLLGREKSCFWEVKLGNNSSFHAFKTWHSWFKLQCSNSASWSFLLWHQSLTQYYPGWYIQYLNPFVFSYIHNYLPTMHLTFGVTLQARTFATALTDTKRLHQAAEEIMALPEQMRIHQLHMNQFPWQALEMLSNYEHWEAETMFLLGLKHKCVRNVAALHLCIT